MIVELLEAVALLGILCIVQWRLTVRLRGNLQRDLARAVAEHERWLLTRLTHILDMAAKARADHEERLERLINEPPKAREVEARNAEAPLAFARTIKRN